MGFFDKLFKRDWRYYRDRGDRYVSKDEHGLALHEYREALKRLDDDSEREALDSAMAKVKDILREKQLERARTFRKGVNPERAFDALDIALTLTNTPDDEAEVNALRKDIEQGITDKANAQKAQIAIAADKDITADPEEARFTTLLGVLEDEEAEHYETLNKEFRRGFLTLHDGDFKNALKHLKKARQAHPKDGFVMAEHGRCLIGLNRFHDAAQVLRKADDAAPKSLYVKMLRVDALWALESYDEAEAVLQAAHDLAPSDERVLRKISEHALRAQDYDSGIDAVNALLDKSPNDIELLRRLGLLYRGRGDHDRALGTFESVLKLQWRRDQDTGQLIFDPTSALHAAMIYIDKEQRLDRAIDLLHALLSVTQGLDSVDMYFGIAKAYKLKGQKTKARETLEALKTKLPGNTPHEIKTEINKRLKEL